MMTDPGLLYLWAALPAAKSPDCGAIAPENRCKLIFTWDQQN
jgi:hypothetical protein